MRFTTRGSNKTENRTIVIIPLFIGLGWRGVCELLIRKRYEIRMKKKLDKLTIRRILIIILMGKNMKNMVIFLSLLFDFYIKAKESVCSSDF